MGKDSHGKSWKVQIKTVAAEVLWQSYIQNKNKTKRLKKQRKANGKGTVKMNDFFYWFP